MTGSLAIAHCIMLNYADADSDVNGNSPEAVNLIFAEVLAKSYDRDRCRRIKNLIRVVLRNLKLPLVISIAAWRAFFRCNPADSDN